MDNKFGKMVFEDKYGNTDFIASIIGIIVTLLFLIFTLVTKSKATLYINLVVTIALLVVFGYNCVKAYQRRKNWVKIYKNGIVLYYKNVTENIPFTDIKEVKIFKKHGAKKRYLNFPILILNNGNTFELPIPLTRDIANLLLNISK